MATRKTKKTAVKHRELKDVLLSFAKAENELTSHPEFQTDWVLHYDTQSGEENVTWDDIDRGECQFTKIVINTPRAFEVK